MASSRFLAQSVLLCAILIAAASTQSLRAQQPSAAKAAKDLPLRWSMEVVGAPDFADPVFDRDGQFLVIAGRNRTEAVVLNLRGKVARGELPAMEFQHDGEAPVAIEKSTVAFRSANRRDLLLWDLSDAKLTEVPHKFTKGRSLISFSANGRFISIARPRSIPPAKATVSQLDLMDTKTGKSVVSFDWQPGHVYYTADSSRALVVDAADRFQWFRLPSGKLDGEWKYDREPGGLNTSVLSMSNDGSVLLYSGAPREKEPGLHLLDGKAGNVIHSFPPKMYLDGTGFLAPDGNSVALLRTNGFGTANAIEILDRNGVLLGKARFPQRFMSVAVSWEARVVALYDRDLKKLWIHDLPGGSTALIARSRDRGPGAKPLEWAPGEAAIAKAELIVRQSLKTEYAQKQPAARRALVDRLIALAQDANGDPAARFVMLRDARDIAVDLHDPSLCLRAVNELATTFQVDGPAQTLGCLERVLASSSDPDALRVVADAAVPAIEAALATDEFDEAVQFAQLAASSARKGRLSPATTDDADARLAHARKSRDSFASIRPALDTLRVLPDDDAANTSVGKFRCFVQGRWEEGLKLLARGTSSALRTIAELDLKAVAGGNSELTVADTWWDHARTAPDDERWGALARSRYWYTRAVPGLSGPNKTRAESRLGISSGGTDYRPGLLCEISSKQTTLPKGKRARLDPVIDFSGSEFADGGKQTDLTLKWTGAIAPPLAGHYTLSAVTSDSVRVRVDNRIVVDTFTAKSSRRESQVVLGERPVPIVVEFAGTNTDRHRIKLKWTRPGESSPEVIPAEYLFHDRRSETVLGKASP